MPDHDPPAAVRTPSGAPPAAGSLPSETPPFPVPDHTLIRRVGRGAYGEVWLARNTLGTWRAVKFIRRSSFDDDRPFERELAGFQRFEPISRSHESQLNILHVGRAEDGFYYVMELADDMGRGQDIDEATYTPRNLRSELQVRGRLPAAECLRIGLALTTALEHLHKHGLVHRDIKPSNIVFVNGIPKLADIGLVARAEATISFVGTEGFLPPEGPGTRQADIYSLGKVLYEISTGHDRQQFPELPTNIVEFPDRAELSELNEVLLKACHRDPKERYQTAAEMHVDLALLESGRSVVRMRGLERRLRFVQRAGAIITVIAAVAAGLYLWQARQTQIVRELAEQNRVIAEEKTRLAVEKTSLAEENRQRIVRLDIANGIRLLDEGDPSGALVWFADALPLVTNKPSEEAIHRVRIEQVFQQMPRSLVTVDRSHTVGKSAWSPDASRFALVAGNPAEVSLHDARDGHTLWSVKMGTRPSGGTGNLRFSRDGKHLFYESFAAMLDVATGTEFFPGFASNAVSAGFSPDERWLAVAHSNHVIRVGRAGEEREFIELTGHTNTITSFAFSADGNLLASASKDQSIRLWRLPSGEPAGPPLWHSLPLRRVALSDDGRRLATTTFIATNARCIIQLWDTRSCRMIGAPITIPMSAVYEEAGAFFSPISGDRLFTAGRSSVLSVWDAEPQMLRATLKTGRVRCWDFSPDGTKLFVGCEDGTAAIWSVDTGELLYTRFRQNGSLDSVRVSPDGARVLTAGRGEMAKVWSLRQETNSATQALSADFAKVTPNGYSPCITPGSISVYLADGAIHLIDPERLTESQRFGADQPDTEVGVWSVGATGRFWATSDRPVSRGDSQNQEKDTPCNLRLWQRTASGFHHSGLPHPKALVDAMFSHDESQLITICMDRAIRIWRTADGALERITAFPKDLALLPLRDGVEWLRPDGMAMLVLDRETGRNLQQFDLTKGKLIGQPFTGFSGPATNLRFSPDGSRLFMAMRSAVGLVIDLQSPTNVIRINHSGYIRELEWSPDGRRLLTAGLTDNARLWDAMTGEQLLSPMVSGKKGSDTYTARWSVDSRFIVTRSDDNFARVWDATTAEAVTPYLRHSGYIRFAYVTANNRLITGSDPNLLSAWDLKPTLLPLNVIADYAKLSSGRRLSASGTLLPVAPAELVRLQSSLRARAPQLFE